MRVYLTYFQLTGEYYTRIVYHTGKIRLDSIVKEIKTMTEYPGLGLPYNGPQRFIILVEIEKLDFKIPPRIILPEISAEQSI